MSSKPLELEQPSLPRQPRFCRLSAGFMLVMAVALVNGCGLNQKAEQAVEATGTELGVGINVGEIDLSILGGAGQITRFDVNNPDGYHAENAFEMKLLRLDLKVLSVFKSPFTLNELIIDSPVVNLELKDPDGSNLKDIADKISGGLSDPEAEGKSASEDNEPGPEESTEPPRLSIKKLRIEGATFTLRRLDGTTESGTLPTIDLDNLGGNEGASMATVAATIAIAVAGEILEQTTARDLGDMDADTILMVLEDRLRGLSAELSPAARKSLAEQVAGFEQIMDDATAQGLVNKRSMSANISVLSASVVEKLKDSLSAEQAQQLAEYLESLDSTAISTAQARMTDRLQQRLMLSEHQIETIRPLLTEGFDELTLLLERHEGNYDDFAEAYTALRQRMVSRFSKILDPAQIESLQVWGDKIERRIQENYFPES